MLISYGRWLDPAPEGVIDSLPGHNSSYKRAILLAYGPALEKMLEAESVLHWDLGAKGYHLYLIPAAKTFHLNFERLFSWLSVQFYAGRLFASRRVQHWSFPRRFFYFTLSPVIPWVRLFRILRELRQPGRPRNLLPNILPALAIGLILNGAGEMMGYVFGGERRWGNCLIWSSIAIVTLTSMISKRLLIHEFTPFQFRTLAPLFHTIPTTVAVPFLFIYVISC